MIVALPINQVRAESKFKDIVGHWAETSIVWAVNQQIVQGFEDGSFKPDQSVTEAEFIAMCIRFFPNSLAKNNELLKNLPNPHDWTSSYYQLSAPLEFNIPNRGKSMYVYRDLPINRGLVAKIIAGASGKNYVQEAAIVYLYEHDLSNGKIDQTIYGFDPDALLTRAEAVQFFKQMADQGLNKELIKRHLNLDSSPTINIEKYNRVTNLNKRPGRPTQEEVEAVLGKYHYDTGRYYDIDGERGVSPCYHYDESQSKLRSCLELSFDVRFDSFEMSIYSRNLLDHIVEVNEEVQFAELVKALMALYGFPTTDSTIDDILVPTFADKHVDSVDPRLADERQFIHNEVDFSDKPYGDDYYASYSHRGFYGIFSLRKFKIEH